MGIVDDVLTIKGREDDLLDVVLNDIRALQRQRADAQALAREALEMVAETNWPALHAEKWRLMRERAERVFAPLASPIAR